LLLCYYSNEHEPARRPGHATHRRQTSKQSRQLGATGTRRKPMPLRIAPYEREVPLNAQTKTKHDKVVETSSANKRETRRTIIVAAKRSRHPSRMGYFESVAKNQKMSDQPPNGSQTSATTQQSSKGRARYTSETRLGNQHRGGITSFEVGQCAGCQIVKASATTISQRVTKGDGKDQNEGQGRIACGGFANIANQRIGKKERDRER